MIKQAISHTDFEKLDLRVGRVVDCQAPEWSDKLLEFTVDFGDEFGKKTVLAGVKKYFQPDFFQGRLFVFIVNLAERKMGQGVSQGMMLMVDEDEKPIPLEITEPAAEGSVIR